MNQVWFSRNGTDLMIEQPKYLIHLIEPERRLSLLQIAYEPQTHTGFISQFFLRQLRYLPLLLDELTQYRFHNYTRCGIKNAQER